jgi:hypothetical protein
MTDEQNTTRPRERKAPGISVNAHIERTTEIKADHLSSGGMVLDFSGFEYGGVTLFFQDRETMRRVGRVIAEFLA